MNHNPFEPLLLQIAQQALSIHAKLGTAESCTGGLIAANCTALAGSSEWFECGIVTYSNQSKMALLGVHNTSLEQYGAVSETVVLEMVKGLIARNNVTTGVAVSGIAGPAGGSSLKPVGTVCIAWQHLGHSKSQSYCFPGNRNDIRQATVKTALEGILDLMRQTN